jgi:hypothetical protein
MRIVRNGRFGKFRSAPTPLEICPGRTIWEKHRDLEYLVFVDESFYKFFGFADVDGNFCHAALGVPKDSYAHLQTSIRPLIEAYEHQIGLMTGEQPRELKSTLLARLPLEFRASFTKELVRSLVAAGGFVAGFYSTTRGMVMERVRTNLLDDATTTVPDDHTDLYNAARTELLTQFQGVGQSDLIERLLLLPFSALSNLMNSFECKFRIRYDPRGTTEDEEVRNAMGRYMESLTRVPELFGNVNPFLGMEIHIPSHDDIGLQLVDVVAGEVRSFFRRNPEALNESATLRLITGDSDEPLEYFMEFNDSVHKIGALSPMTPGLVTKLAVENSENLVSYYYPVLAAGILACVTETGQPRLLEIPTQLILDQRE